MRPIFWTCLVCGGVLGSVPAVAESPRPTPPPEMRILAGQDGTWDVAFQVLDAKQRWQTSKCTAKIRMVLDGQGQTTDFEGTVNGAKYQGTGLTCYDQETQLWQSTWADNQGGRITLYQGTWTRNTLVLQGVDRAEGEKILSRITLSQVGPSHFDWLMEVSVDGRTFTPAARASYDKR